MKIYDNMAPSVTCQLVRLDQQCMRMFLYLVLLGRYLVTAADLTYTIYEDKPKDTPVGNIAQDYDFRSLMTMEDYNNLQYQILRTGNDVTKYFRLVNTTGQLLTTEPIDRDNIAQCVRLSKCVLSFDVAVASSGAFFRKLTIDVNVTDLNDNSPLFTRNVETVNFTENSAEGTAYSIPGATDKDAGNNTVKNYYIETGNVPFDVEMETYVDGSSFVKIVVKGLLDREKTGSYNIKIIAEDGGTPKRTGSIDVKINVLDSNDNSPKFAQPYYNVTLNEDTPLNTVFLTVSATDDDAGENGQVEYKLSANQKSLKIPQKFAVDHVSGNLSVIGQLEYIPNEDLSIYVDAVDKGSSRRSSKVLVLVNIYDSINSPPKIILNILHGDRVSMVARITEYANVGFTVGLLNVVETDYDTERNGKVDCISLNEFFGLERYDTYAYKAVVRQPLDRELKDRHEVKIVCRDNGSPPLNDTTTFTVEVLDENDNSPRFTQNTYFEKAAENNNVGDIVAIVKADDLDQAGTNNSKIVYKLAGTGGYQFWIDPDSGQIRANFVIDRENRSRFELQVIAEDLGSPRLSAVAQVSLSITDENDNRPVFSQPNYEFFVYENLPYNTSVDQLTATDKDERENGTIVFSFGNPVPSSFPFALYSDGNIKVIRSLDREIQSEYRFTVFAADQGNPSLTTSVTVTVNVLDQNDNPPVFVFPNNDNNTATIPLSSAPESVSVEIRATDRDSGDNGRVSYAIVGNNTGVFFMETFAGIGLVKVRRLPADNEPLTYSLEIKAEDSGSPRKATFHSLNVIFKRAVPPEENRTNFIIAIVLGCCTIAISIVIVLIIYFIRRSDYRRQKREAKTYSDTDKAEFQIRPEIKHPSDLNRSSSSSSGSKESLKKVSFTTDHNSSMESESHKDFSHAPLVTMETKVLDNGRLHSTTSSLRSFSPHPQESDSKKPDPASVLQIHRTLLQSRDPMWTNHREAQTPPLTSEILAQHEDNRSESSGETETYDSGRGGSESDIQTSMSQSHENDHIKTVTFANQPKFHQYHKENHWSDVRNLFPHPSGGLSTFSPQKKPSLPTRDYLTSPKPPSQLRYAPQHYNASKYLNKLSPITDGLSRMTSYDEDDETTTSGSYTIDNDPDWLNESHGSPRPYFLSSNEAYC